MSAIHVENHGPVRVITLQRPEVRNALDTALLTALADALGEATAAESVDVIVLTGAGGTFCAGADEQESLDRDGAVRRAELLGQVCEMVATSPQPSIAAIDGVCFGHGAELAAACDLRVAGAKARFAFTGPALGEPFGAAKLVALLGFGMAKELVFTSREITAPEAQRVGFTQRIARDGESLKGALDLAETIAANHRDTVRHLKRQFDAFSGNVERMRTETGMLRALAEAGGDFAAVADQAPR